MADTDVSVGRLAAGQHSLITTPQLLKVADLVAERISGHSTPPPSRWLPETPFCGHDPAIYAVW